MLINGINYHVESWGAGEPLVLLHGFTGSGANWQPHADVFAQRWRVVTIDLPGHGQTDSPVDPARYRIERAAQDLIAILDALDLGTINLLGYSMGGRLALYTAVSFLARVRRLIVESASPGLRTDAERQARIEQDEALAGRIERGGIATFADYWTSLPLFATQSPEDRDTLRRQRLRNNPIGIANSLRGMGTGVQPPLWDRLPDLDIPVLLLCGAQDGKFAAINRHMCGLLPRAALIAISGAGHTIHVEQPEQFRSAVVQFLAGQNS